MQGPREYNAAVEAMTRRFALQFYGGAPSDCRCVAHHYFPPMATMNMVHTGRRGSPESPFSVVHGASARLVSARGHRSCSAATADAAPCRTLSKWLRRTSGLILVALSAACSSVGSYMSTSVREGAVQNCIKKSCAGASEATDYQSCEATCRERFGP
jgi:hypothetical protein